MDYLICVTDFSICNTDYPICVTDFSICNTDYPIMLQIEHFDKNIYPYISCLFLSELSPHPYIFFNPDHATMTFLGFQVDQNGNLLDPKTKEIIKRNIMSRPLRTGLHVQKVDLDNNFESYSK